MRAAAFLMPLVLLLAVACTGDDDEPTPTATAEPSASASPTLEPIESLREADFSAAELIGR